MQAISVIMLHIWLDVEACKDFLLIIFIVLSMLKLLLHIMQPTKLE